MKPVMATYIHKAYRGLFHSRDQKHLRVSYKLQYILSLKVLSFLNLNSTEIVYYVIKQDLNFMFPKFVALPINIS